jgi:hypothetical protein
MDILATQSLAPDNLLLRPTCIRDSTWSIFQRCNHNINLQSELILICLPIIRAQSVTAHARQAALPIKLYSHPLAHCSQPY